MTELVEEAVDIGVYHPCPARPYRFAYRLDGLMRVALGPKPIRAGQKVGLKDRLEHDLQGLLDHPITHIADGGGIVPRCSVMVWVLLLLRILFMR